MSLTIEGAGGILGVGAEVRGARALDRLGFWRPVRPSAPGRRQLTVPLGSRVLSLSARRPGRDWPGRFGHEVLLAKTFVDPARFRGTVYRAANWIEAGRTRCFACDGYGYSEHGRPKLVFLHPLF